MWCLLMPLLGGIYPVLLLYANNSDILLLQSLLQVALLAVLPVVVFYVVFLGIVRRPIAAANATFVFLLFFHTYGIVYTYWRTEGSFRMRHETLLPIFAVLGLGASWLVSRLQAMPARRVWNSLALILGVLFIFNLARIIPVEAGKRMNLAPEAATAGVPAASARAYPDIYLIIFDEFSGFEPMREYWHNDEQVGAFVEFLQSNGFMIAEQSHSRSIMTLHQVATRLNYEELPCDPQGHRSRLSCDSKYRRIWFQRIADNRAMRYLKSKGYSTVVFEELSGIDGFEAMPSILADYTFKPETEVPSGLTSWFDEFGIFVTDNTMLRAFPAWYSGNNFSLQQHRDMVKYTIRKIGRLDEVPSPRFAYVHLMLPHKPFMYDENGGPLPVRYRANWNYYLGQYNYTLKVARKIVNNILRASDPERPPVIILQSDHGARNIKNAPTTVVLDNFPDEYKTSILFALHLPGFDPSDLPQDVNPDNTFPIVFNHVFGDDIPLAK